MPIRTGAGPPVFLRDVGTVERQHRHPDRLRAGQRPARGLHPGHQAGRRLDARASSSEVKANLPRLQALVPDDINVVFEFDQSPYVSAALESVLRRGDARRAADRADGAAVPARLAQRADRRRQHPVRAAGRRGRAVGSRPDDQPDDAGRAGAGRRHPGGRGDGRDREHPHAAGARDAASRAPCSTPAAKTAVPRLLAMLCILAVFVPSFFMKGVARSLFVPLSLAVGFAMIASYLLSSTFVPVLSVWWLAAHERARQEGARERLGRARCATVCVALLDRAARRRVAARRRLLSSVAPSSWLFGRADARPRDLPAERRQRSSSFGCARRPGTQVRAHRATGAARRWTSSATTVGADNVEITLGYVGVQPSAIRSTRSTCGPAARTKAVLQVALKPDAPVAARASFKEQLRARASPTRCPDVRFSFEPADIVSQVMSFGSPTPIEVAVRGPTSPPNRAFADEGPRPSWPRSRRCATCSSASRSTTRRSRSTSTASRPGQSA